MMSLPRLDRYFLVGLQSLRLRVAARRHGHVENRQLLQHGLSVWENTYPNSFMRWRLIKVAIVIDLFSNRSRPTGWTRSHVSGR